MNKQPRVPAGNGLRGGQFATSQHSEADVELTTDLFGEQAPEPEDSAAQVGPDMAGQDLSWANLRDANLEAARAAGADFTHADLRGARMAGINAARASFRSADLTGADLTGASFPDADFYDAKLGESLADTDLRDTAFDRAEVHGATDVDFRGAHFTQATLSGEFVGCDFRGADFRGCAMDHPKHPRPSMPYRPVTFVGCQFDDDPWDGGAEWPDDFDPRTNAAFRRAGFDADAQAEWEEEAGITGPADAAAWRDAGFEPGLKTARFHENFGSGQDAADAAARFAQLNFDPDVAVDWNTAGFDADEAREWTEHGFTASGPASPMEDAVAWSEAGVTPVRSAMWADASYIPAEARAHIDAGYPNPDGAPEPARPKAIDRHVAALSAERIGVLRRRKEQLTAEHPALGTDAEAELAAVAQLIHKKSRGRS